MCAFNGAFDDMLIIPQQSCHSNYEKWEIVSELSASFFRNPYHLHFDFCNVWIAAGEGQQSKSVS